MIPVFIIEEHNEAFFIWHHAISQNIISPNSNILLHVDEHADMEKPHPENYSVLEKPDSDFLMKLTRENLAIDDFIIPCIYQGIFNQVYWLRRAHNQKEEKSI